MVVSDAFGVLPCVDEMVDDFRHSLTVLDLRKYKWAIAPHSS